MLRNRAFDFLFGKRPEGADGGKLARGSDKRMNVIAQRFIQAREDCALDRWPPALRGIEGDVTAGDECLDVLEAHRFKQVLEPRHRHRVTTDVDCSQKTEVALHIIMARGRHRLDNLAR